MPDVYAIAVDGNPLVPGYCRSAVMLEGTAAGRVEVHEFAYQDGGDVQLEDWATSPKLTILRTVLATGTPAQVYEAHHDLSALLLGGRKTLQRTDPFAGAVEAEVAVVDSTRQKEQVNRLEWDWPMWILPGHFRGTTDVTDAASGVTGSSSIIGTYTPGGTHPTAPVVTITNVSAGDNPSLVMTTGKLESIDISGSFDGEVIVVDVPARTVTVDGVRAKNISNPSHAQWIRWAAGIANTLTFESDSGTWDIDVAYRERWRI